MTTYEERKQFIDIQKLTLQQSFYGLPPLKDSLINGPNYKAIKELIVRMNVFVIKGVKDTGKISYPEANRIIYYTLDPTSIKKCNIMMKSLNKKIQYLEVPKNQIIYDNR